MVYVNIVWYENESIIIRGYKDRESAIKDTCDINDLFYIFKPTENYTWDSYFDFSEDLREDDIDIVDYIKYHLDLLNDMHEDYCIIRYLKQNLQTNEVAIDFHHKEVA